MRRSRFRQFIGGTAAIAIALGVAIGVPIIKKGISNTGTSNGLFNLYVVATGGNPGCVRSSTPIAYNVNNTNNCGPGTGPMGFSTTGWDNACNAATFTDTIGVMPGKYGKAPSATNSAIFSGAEDCSDGQGADVNPNAVEQLASTGTTANWVTYRCAQTPCGITFDPFMGRPFFFRGNYHAIFENIPWTLGFQMGSGGENPGDRVQNVQIVGSSRTNLDPVFGVQIIGAKNILLKNIDYGPSNQCAAVGANAAAQFQCDPNGPYFESQWANIGTNSAGCAPDTSSLCGGYFYNDGGWAEGFIHDGGAGPYLNLRLDNVIYHDENARMAGLGVHPGCFFTFDSGNATTTTGNLVMDHLVCIRTTGATLQLADSGVIVQNSVFTCLVATLNQTTPINKWDVCVGGGASGFSAKDPNGNPCNAASCNMQNDIIRFNTFIAGGGGAAIAINDKTVQGTPFGSHTNDRFIGNLIIGPATCSVPGVTFNNNAYSSGTTVCGDTSSQTITGDPFNNSSILTPGDLYTTGSNLGGFDPHLDGTPVVPTLNATSLGSDYTLDHDCDGNPRVISAMRYGACN